MEIMGILLVTKHLIEGRPIWALYGHLNSDSIADKEVGQKISRGEVICWIGDRHENGGRSSSPLSPVLVRS